MQRTGTLWGGIAAPKLRNAEQSGIQTTTDRSKGFWFSQVGRSLLHWLFGNSEPRIWQTRDRKGNTTWHIYDPVIQVTTHFGSEAEVRVWLEQRYYQH